MKTKAKTILLAAATLAGMTACTNDDNNVAVDNNAPVAVRITAGMADAVATPGTRAVGPLWNKDSIGVIVSTATNSNMPEKYKNACYVTDSEGETAAFTPKDEANTIYFDNDDDVSFRAYAPYQPSANPATLPGTNGVIIIDATKQTTPEEQEAIDFITAGAVVAKKSNPQVAFNGENNFTHIMSRLVLKIEIPEVDGVSSSAVERISSISLGGLCTGGTFDLNAFISSGSNILQPDRSTWTENWEISGYVKNATNNTVTYTLILIPQHITFDQTGNSRNDLPVNITLDGKSYQACIIVNPDSPGNFMSGNSYECTIRFTKTGVGVDESIVKDWTEWMTSDFFIKV